MLENIWNLEQLMSDQMEPRAVPSDRTLLWWRTARRKSSTTDLYRLMMVVRISDEQSTFRAGTSAAKRFLDPFKLA